MYTHNFCKQIQQLGRMALLLAMFVFATSASAQIIPIDPPKKNPPAQPNPQGGGKQPKPSKIPKTTTVKPEKTERTGTEIFTAKIGGGLNYYLGAFNEPAGQFDTRKFSGQFNGMLGVRYGQLEKASAFGAFVSYGVYSKAAAAEFTPFALNGHFLEIEGGLVVGEIWRISAGYGMAKFYAAPGDASSIYDDNYISTTTGFSFGPKNFKFEMLGTVMFSQLENRVTFRPSIGVAAKLDFLKRKA